MAFDVTTTIDGTVYGGTYSVSGRTVTVSALYGSKTKQIGGMPVQTLARLMLGEIIREEIGRKDSMIKRP